VSDDGLNHSFLGSDTIVKWLDAYVLEDYTTSIFRVTSPWRWRQHGPPKHWYPTVLESNTIYKTMTGMIPNMDEFRETGCWSPS